MIGPTDLVGCRQCVAAHGCYGEADPPRAVVYFRLSGMARGADLDGRGEGARRRLTAGGGRCSELFAPGGVDSSSGDRKGLCYAYYGEGCWYAGQAQTNRASRGGNSAAVLTSEPMAAGSHVY